MSEYILVDMLGLILKVVVHPADVQDREGGKLVIDGIKQVDLKLEKLWADQGYIGGFLHWAKDSSGLQVEVVYPWWRQANGICQTSLRTQIRARRFTSCPAAGSLNERSRGEANAAVDQKTTKRDLRP